MHRFWKLAIEPVLEAVSPKRIVEVGAEEGENTRRLLKWGAHHDAVVESIDPDPRFDVAQWKKLFGSGFVFHRNLSLEALPEIEPADMALIDGDHNWYTVINELRLLDRGELGPAVMLHDVDWPYGRRDLYYRPETIPAEYRQRYAKAGLRPGEEGFAEPGLNAHLCNAIIEGGPRNGVRSAVEDFCAESEREWTFVSLPGLHGLGILVAQERLRARPEVAQVLSHLDESPRLRRLVEAVESERLGIEIRRTQARKLLARATEATEPPSEESQEPDELVEELRGTALRLQAAELLAARLQEDLSDREAAVVLELERMRVRADRSEAKHAAQVSRADELQALLDASVHDRQALAERLERLKREHAEALRERDALQVAATELRREHVDLENRERRLAERIRVAERTIAQALGHEDGRGGEPEPSHLERGAAPIPTPVAQITATSGDGSSKELIERHHFLARVAELWPAGSRVEGLHDPLSVPEMSNHHGFLVARHEREETRGATPTVDVVVCIHNALEDVRRCLWSLAARASYPFHLLLVNDGSDDEMTAWLGRQVAANPAVELIHNAAAPHGYTVAANLGLNRSSADYVVLLNSDTIVTTGWIERLLACGESDHRIGVLGPLSNAASHQSVPRLRENGAWAVNQLPSWLTEDGMATIIRRISKQERPRLPFINGFCYVIKREVLAEIGCFDQEHFAEGYCEENDFSYRAQQAGYELAVADDAYVFHAKSRSYTTAGRNEKAKRNYQVFLDKHDRAHIDKLVSSMEENLALAPLREEAERASSSAPASGQVISGSEPLRVTFILPGISKGGSGGSHSIYQEVRGMRALGVPAEIALSAAAWERALWAYEDAEEIFKPFADLDELSSLTVDSHVISATHFKSVAMLAHLRSLRNDFLPAYYVQDYEPFFMLDGHADHGEALASYTKIPDALLFAKTHWLSNAIGHAHGVHVAKVEPSIDSGLFHPADRPAEGSVWVLGMVRPRTPRRQPAGTLALLARLRREHGERVQTITFGCETAELARITDDPTAIAAHRGTLKRDQVAELLRRADVFLDFSTYQAFGRTALEAMACGCAPIVPRIGGAAEFAVHGHNCLVADTCDDGATYETLASLVADPERLRTMQACAAVTGARYSILRAALSEYVLFENEYRRRMSAVPKLDQQRVAR